MKYRKLDDSEIEQLKHQGCQADEWNSISVKESFSPSFLQNVHFSGEVYLGIFGSMITISEGIEKSSIIVLQGLTRLRQIANHPKMVDENYQENSGKFLEIVRNIQNIISEGHKVLIFSSYAMCSSVKKTRFGSSTPQGNYSNIELDFP